MAAAFGFVLVYVVIGLSRVAFPYDIQWMEGGMVDHVRRIMAGDQLYIAPGVDFTPYIYTPFYFYVSAAVSTVTGIGLLPLRLVALMSSLISFALIGALVRHETRNNFAALLAVGMFAATFVLGGAWFDLARNDTLMLALVLGGIYAVKVDESRLGVVVSAVLFVLAGLTKQTALAIAVAIIVYYLLTKWRYGVLFIVLFGGLTLAATLALDSASGGWYTYYAFDLPGQHPWVRDMLVDFWRLDLAPVMIVGIIGLVYLLTVWRESWRNFLFYGLLAGAMIGSAWLSRLHEGGYINVLIPAFAIIAVLFGLGVNHVRKIDFIQNHAARLIVMYALCLVQFAVLIYTPTDQMPTALDRAAGDHMVETVRGFEGDVWVVHHGYIAYRAGKNEIFAHRMALEDVMRGTDTQIRDALAANIQQAIAEQRFSAIIFDGSRDNFILVDYYFANLQEFYVGVGEILPDEFDGALWPRTGLELRPYYVFVPIPQ